jgi:hypothetical protein
LSESEKLSPKTIGTVGLAAAGTAAIHKYYSVKDKARKDANRKMKFEHQRSIEQSKPVEPSSAKARYEAEMNTRPKEARSAAKTSRLARKAAKAAGRGMGAVGIAAGLPGAIADSADIAAEGGAFEARFGKFVEKMIGLPAGATGRPLTNKEKRTLGSI